MKNSYILYSLNKKLIVIVWIVITCNNIYQKYLKQRWIVAKDGIQNVCFILFSTCQMSVPPSELMQSLVFKPSAFRCTLQCVNHHLPESR